MHWHELRHTYATILAENELSLKAIASVMGYSKEIFTVDTYVNPRQLIADGLSILTPFIEEVLPHSNEESLSLDTTIALLPA